MQVILTVSVAVGENHSVTKHITILRNSPRNVITFGESQIGTGFMKRSQVPGGNRMI